MTPRYLIGIIGLALVDFAAAAPLEVTGKISQITEKFVAIKEAQYPIRRGVETNLRINVDTTQCYVNQVRITCGTLASVGYVDHARVVVENGYAVRIDVLQMLQ